MRRTDGLTCSTTAADVVVSSTGLRSWEGRFKMLKVEGVTRGADMKRLDDRWIVGLLTVFGVFAVMPVFAGDAGAIDCGRDIVRNDVVLDLPAGVTLQLRSQAAAGPFTIVLNAGPGLVANPTALATFQQAAALWESKFDDPVTVVIDADLANLGAGILGSTGSRSFAFDYTLLRNAMANDADFIVESFVSSLPTAGTLGAILPPGFTLQNRLVASKANLRALGIDVSFDGGQPDASITFSTGFVPDFDFDPSDGITAGKFDFEAIVVHELGHALGFISSVDTVDFVLSQGSTASITLRTLDMFRLRPGDGALNFSTNLRIASPGNLESTQMFFDGATDLGLSTGRSLGDGNQASHWKADELTGVFIGVMDPTLSRGVREEITDNDVRAFGLIGWDVIPPPVNCDDGDVCTFDRFVLIQCLSTPAIYGDVNHDDSVNLFDLFCVLDGFSGDFSTCSFADSDIEPCIGNDTVNLFDLFAILDVFTGIDPCCSGP